MEKSRLTKPGIYADQFGSGIRRFNVELDKNQSGANYEDAPEIRLMAEDSRPNANVLEALRCFWRQALHH
ncbi:MAG TPA: hypothetical protein VLZ81_00565 [Blastocatellia bacterium]|nr:hypothetical protein [Blastocatellia bacterium]